MEQNDLFYTETEELDYRRFLMLRPGADMPTTSTEIQNVRNEGNCSSNSESILSVGNHEKKHKILQTLEPDINVTKASSRKYRKGELTNKENKSCDCLAKVMTQNEETRRVLMRLTEEVIILKKEIKMLKATTKVTHIEEMLPKFPYTYVEQLIKLERKVQDNESCFSLLKEEFLSSANRSNPEQFVRGSLKRIFTDKLATQFTWIGTKQKKCVRSMNIILALKGAFKERFNGSDDIFERVSKKHFHYAADRLSKVRVRQLKKAPPSSSSTSSINVENNLD